MSSVMRALGGNLKKAIQDKRDEYEKYGIAVDLDYKHAMRQNETDDVVRVLQDPDFDGNYKINYVLNKLTQVAGPYYRAGSEQRFAKLVKWLTMAEIEWRRTYNTNMEMTRHYMVKCLVLYKKTEMFTDGQGKVTDKEVDDWKYEVLTPMTFCALLKLGKVKIISMGNDNELDDKIFEVQSVDPKLHKGEKPALTSEQIVDRLNKIAEEDFLPFLRAAWYYQFLDKDLSAYNVNVLHMAAKQDNYADVRDTRDLTGKDERPNRDPLPRTSKA